MLTPLENWIVEECDSSDLTLLHHLLQSHEVSINALGGGSGFGSFDMLLGRLPVQSPSFAPRSMWVKHRFDKGIRLGRDASDDLGSALVELPSRSRLVGTALTILTERPEKARVGELNDHLGPRIWGRLEPLYGGFPVLGQMERHCLGVNEVESGNGGILDGLLRLRGDVEIQGFRDSRGGSGTLIKGRVFDHLDDLVAHRDLRN